MKEVKDTLGIKYEKLALIYNYDNENTGKLIKYLMWEFGKDVVLKDLNENQKQKMIKEMKKLEYEINDMIENDYIFNIIYTEMTQQISKSHRHWEILKNNIENAKAEKNSAKTSQNTPQSDKTPSDTETHEETENGTQGDSDGEEWEMKTIMIFNTETEKEEKWVIEFPKRNAKNIPNETINEKYVYDEIVKILDTGYEDGWKKYWEDYLESEEK